MADMKWIPVTERLPKSESIFLVAVTGNGTHSTYFNALTTASFYDGSWCVDIDPHWMSPCVTHWMPLPEPPKEVE